MYSINQALFRYFVFLQIIWKPLYSTMSGIDGSTMYQLRNLINRRNVVKDPSNNFAASEDFILLLTEAHIVAAAMTVFGMASVDNKPSLEMFNATNESSLERRKILGKATDLIVKKFVDLSCQNLMDDSSNKEQGIDRDDDQVQAYASKLLTLGLLLMEFSDGIREGDGVRILRCWKYFLLLFKANNRTNYSIEALNLLTIPFPRAWQPSLYGIEQLMFMVDHLKTSHQIYIWSI